jgi:enamine deaminase RidA (YjgF/YER057c/UK114 family)
MDFTQITLLRPAGLVNSPAFSHVAVVPPGAATVYVGGQNGVDAEGELVSHEAGRQAGRALDNAAAALAAVGAGLADVIQWNVLFVEGVDLQAAYGAIGPRLGAAAAEAGAPPLVTGARVAALGVPGALIEISAVAAILPA